MAKKNVETIPIDLDNIFSALGQDLAKTLFKEVKKAHRKAIKYSVCDFSDEITKLELSLRCANCPKEINFEKTFALYCSDRCQQTANLVRYVRRGCSEKRENNLDFQIGIGDILNHLRFGSYPSRERTLSHKIREEVFKRDNYTCKGCGSPADQIDHINGSLPSLSNLQAYCSKCNREKAFSHQRNIPLEELERIEMLYEELAIRIAAPMPLQACDDFEKWRMVQSKVAGKRKSIVFSMRKQAEKLDGDNWEDIDNYVADGQINDN